MLTALVQIVIVAFTGSVALLADTIHNFSDAATAIPLWIAFALARRAPTKRFTYGYGRVEDLAGLVVVLLIAVSAVVAAYESLSRLVAPEPVPHLWAVVLASLIGFAGNEAVALFRIKVGREIGSAALVADGYHARVDGLTSLGVLIGAAGVGLGYPLADPIVGLVISVVIARILWGAAKAVFARLLDGVDPEIVDEVVQVVRRVEGVRDVSDVRVRWLGHRLLAEASIAVDAGLTVEAGHEIASRVRHELLHRVRYLFDATIHVDPETAAGAVFHRIAVHAHDDLPDHAH
jgi:cation diffusion facilitator family transporter